MWNNANNADTISYTYVQISSRIFISWNEIYFASTDFWELIIC